MPLLIWLLSVILSKIFVIHVSTTGAIRLLAQKKVKTSFSLKLYLFHTMVMTENLLEKTFWKKHFLTVIVYCIFLSFFFNVKHTNLEC